MTACRGCGAGGRLYYGLCVVCRVTAAHDRPLNPRFKQSEAIRKAAQNSHAILLGGREYLVCGCDYMKFPLTADRSSHYPQDCPNQKIITVATGHEHGGKGA